MDPEYFQTDSEHDLTLDRVKELFSDDFIKQLDKVFMCGNFGDPAVAKDCIPILKHFKSVNPNITLGMNTNGSIHAPVWWAQLAGVMTGPNDYVVFSIDGLADTNHIYRVGTRWNKIMANAESFISAGGHAHWDMLIYEHNEHQVESIRNLAKNMGFTMFRAKVSSRFETRPIEFLSPPRNWTAINIQSTEIKCHAIEERSLYVSATGQVLPCCFIGAEVFRMSSELTDLINTPNYQGLVASWQSNPHRVCKQYCGTSGTQTQFNAQWRIEEHLC